MSEMVEMDAPVTEPLPIWRKIPPGTLADGVNALEAATGNLLDSLDDLDLRVIVAKVFFAMVAEE